MSFEDVGEINPLSTEDDQGDTTVTNVEVQGQEFINATREVIAEPAERDEILPLDQMEKEVLKDLNESKIPEVWQRTAPPQVIASVGILIEQAQEYQGVQATFYNQVQHQGKKKDDKMQMGTALATALKDQERIRKSMVVNHCRLKYLMELLWAVFKAAEPDIVKEGLWEKNELTKMVQHYVKDILGALCVQPFNDLNYEGNIAPFFESYPKQIILASVGGKWKIVRASMFMLAILLHLKKHRPDVLIQIALHPTMLNEVYIEHLNSIVKRYCVYIKARFFNDIRKCSILCKRD